MKKIKEFLLDEYGGADLSSEGLSLSLHKLIDYVLSVYLRDGEQAKVLILNDRKKNAIENYKISKQDANVLIKNRSSIVSGMITKVMTIEHERNFELYVSALEASTILLDIVRRPIDDKLEDEKWLSALKAKRQGFMDAKELVDQAHKIAEEMTGMSNADIEDHADQSEFRGGVAERFARKADERRKNKKNI